MSGGAGVAAVHFVDEVVDGVGHAGYLRGDAGLVGAESLGLPLLAQIPIVQSICETGDEGRPALTDVASPTGQAFLALAQAIASKARRLKE